MHYYRFNIADYRKDTSHLSLLEHGIYRQLLDTYYLNEQPLDLDLNKVMRSHSVRNADEMQAFKNVLEDFFEEGENGYIHKKCDEQISELYEKSDKAKRSAEARWAKKTKKKQQHDANAKIIDANALRSDCEGNATHIPSNLVTQEEKKEKINKKENPKFKHPSLNEVKGLFADKYPNQGSEADRFWNFYESKGWMVGKNKMKNWHAAAANWMSGKTGGTHMQNKPDRRDGESDAQYQYRVSMSGGSK